MKRSQPPVSNGTAKVGSLPANGPVKTGTAPSAAARRPLSLAARCGMLAVLVYFIRGTVVPWYSHIPDSGWMMLSILSLLAAVGFSVASGGRWRWSWLLVALAFAPGISEAEDVSSATMHWLGLTAIILGIGPVILSPTAMDLRAAAWRLTTKGLPILTGIFVVWYVLHLPSLGGNVFFTGFMNQSMLLGPIAGLGVVIAFSRGLHTRSWKWLALAVFGMIPVMASGSRLATLATGAAVCFLLLRRRPAIGAIVVVLFALAIGGFMAGKHAVSDSDSTSFTNALAKKGVENSRTNLWQSRIDEFKSSPIVGIGVSMGRGGGASVDPNGSMRIEPGSSYLAILSMTGSIGALAFFGSLIVLVFRYVTTRSKTPYERDVLNGVGIFLAVHGVAEGWILSFGSPLCFLFWLWLGNFGDAAVKPIQAHVQSRINSPNSGVPKRQMQGQ